jgi:RNA polymerase sigma factor (sigma-70 family)
MADDDDPREPNRLTTRRRDNSLGGLRTLFGVGAIAHLTDGQLLERYKTGGAGVAELAFAALIERHGPLVSHTCRSILRDEHEAQDAFQATFLILIRKAGSLWVEDSLGPWLHQVAYRAARSCRSAAARRTALERKVAERISPGVDAVPPDAEGEDPGAVIHEEIERLPERYRAPIVLCDLEGRTHEQAARHLGCPVGTVKSRLSRGRERLRARLTRRGLDVPAAPLAVGLLPRAAGASSWVAWWSGPTTWAAVRIAAGRPDTGAVSTAVLALMRCISRELLMDKMKGAALATLTLGALAGIGGMAWAVLGGPADDRGASSKPAASRPAEGQEVPRVGAPVDRTRELADLRGRWEVIYLSGAVAGERQGFPMPNLVVPITEATINLPSLTGKAADPINYLGEMPYVLDPGRKAGEIDMKPGPAGGRSLKGIYRLGGDVLTICYEDAERGRPETFAAGKPSEGLLILRRVDRAFSPAPQPRPGEAPTQPPTGPKSLQVDRST